VLDLCAGCREDDQARLRGVVPGVLLDTAAPAEVRQMSGRQAAMAVRVMAGGAR